MSLPRMNIRALVIGVVAVTAFGLIAATTPPAPVSNPAMTTPDETAWKLFVEANTAVDAKNAQFEAWASDGDTFKPNPTFPTTPTAAGLRPPVLPALRRQIAQAHGQLLPAAPGGGNALEETRRNRAAFDFIVSNNLYSVTGLQKAYGKTPLSFPVDAVEVKANWIAVEQVPAWSLGRVKLADVPKRFHVNTGGDGKAYALVAMHVISKAVPNWTWATFESAYNPNRCDILGCKDAFGAQVALVPPNAKAGAGYPECAKSPALAALMASAKLDPAYANYCLKGSQTDFRDDTGLDVRLGNSVTEDGFVAQSSCMTCHGRAAWNAKGAATSGGGFDNDGTAPLGPINPAWAWTFTAKPPIYQGMNGLVRKGMTADFVWSIPFCAYDDTVPGKPKLTGCASK
jgi:hypothetical protein